LFIQNITRMCCSYIFFLKLADTMRITCVGDAEHEFKLTITG
jgi:hypothetical protein